MKMNRLKVLAVCASLILPFLLMIAVFFTGESAADDQYAETTGLKGSEGKLEFSYRQEVPLSAGEVNAVGMSTGTKAAYTWTAASSPQETRGASTPVLVYTDDHALPAETTYSDQALQRLKNLCGD
jgi:hypothetical protein